MKDKDTISKGPKRREETCYQLQRDIVIPAGTILRYTGNSMFGAQADYGNFEVYRDSADKHPDLYKKVVAS